MREWTTRSASCAGLAERVGQVPSRGARWLLVPWTYSSMVAPPSTAVGPRKECWHPARSVLSLHANVGYKMKGAAESAAAWQSFEFVSGAFHGSLFSRDVSRSDSLGAGKLLVASRRNGRDPGCQGPQGATRAVGEALRDQRLGRRGQSRAGGRPGHPAV